MCSGLINSIGPIARNCPKWPSGNHICGPKLPAKLAFWKFEQETFSCVNQLLTHCTPYALLILRGVLQSDCYLVLNQLLFMVSMILSPLQLIWLYDQLIIEPDMNHQWHNANKTVISRMVISSYITGHLHHRSNRNGHNVRLQNLYSVSNTRLCLYIGPWSGLIMS